MKPSNSSTNFPTLLLISNTIFKFITHPGTFTAILLISSFLLFLISIVTLRFYPSIFGYSAGIITLTLLILFFAKKIKIQNSFIAGCLILGLLNVLPIPFTDMSPNWEACLVEKRFGVGLGFPSQVVEFVSPDVSQRIPIPESYRYECENPYTGPSYFETNYILWDSIYFLLALPLVMFIYKKLLVYR